MEPIGVIMVILLGLAIVLVWSWVISLIPIRSGWKHAVVFLTVGLLGNLFLWLLVRKQA